MSVPVRELRTRYRQGPSFAVPFRLITPVPHGTAQQQHGPQRHLPDHGGTPAQVIPGHAISLSALSFSRGRRLPQSFMLNTWVVAESRSNKAEAKCLFFRN